MKRSYIIVLLLSVLSSLSCSTYSIQTDVEDNKVLSKISSTGIIFRISKNSKITEEELIKNFQYWLNVYKKNKSLTILNNANVSIACFKDPQERFYQLSNENTYLKYKSIGVVNQYLQTNQNELQEIITKNNLDSLMIFEVFTVISTELQFIEFETVLAIADSGLNIAYLDHQTDNFESESSILNDLKNQIADKINCRLIDNLQNLNILGGQTTGERKIAKSGTDKQTKKPAEKASTKSEDKPVEKNADKATEKSADMIKEKPEVKPEDVKTQDQAPDNKPGSSAAKSPVQETKTKDTLPAEKPAEK